MNDQHPPLKVGDRVTLKDTRISDDPIPLIVTNMFWDAHEGEWYATTTDARLTMTVFRRAAWFTRGWPA